MDFKKLDFFKKMTIIMTALSAVIVVCFVISFVSNINSRKAKAKNKNANLESLVNVSVKEMNLETYSESLVVNGELSTLSGTVNVTAPVTGYLRKNSVRLGDNVKAGDVLGVIDASDIGLSYKESNITSPIDGIVTSVPSTINSKVALSSVLYTIEPESDFVITCEVSESDANTIEVGTAAIFYVLGSDEQHHAVLRYIAPVISTATRTVKLELEVNNDEGNLKGLRSGSYVNISLAKLTIENALVLPVNSIRSFMQKDVVYVIDKDNIAHRVDVEVAQSNESSAVITSGIKVGDVVVVQGTPQDGDKVQIL